MATESLAKFGKMFQTQVVAVLLTDVKFLEQVLDLIDIDFFDSEASQWIVKESIKYYREFKTTPSMSIFKIKVADIDSDVLSTVVVDKLREVYLQVGSKDLSFVKEKFLEFCKNKKFEKAIHDSITHLERGNYEQIRIEFDDALRAGEPVNVGHDYTQDISQRMERVVRRTVRTGWEVIDDLMDGGLGPGELGVVVAPPGVGKSWSLVNIAANAVKSGKFVVYYTLELAENYVGLRFDSWFTGMNSHDLRNDKEKVRKVIEKIPGKLLIKYYPTKSIAVNKLESHLNRIETVDRRPDLVIVDYADILISSNKYSDIRHLELGGIYEELRRVAGEREVPIWTASQSNRSSMALNVIKGDSIAESINKLMISDFVMSLARNDKDKLSDKAWWHIIKNRFGADGLTFMSKMDTSIGHIEISDTVVQSRTNGNEESKSSGMEDKSMKKLKNIYESMKRGS